MHSEQFYTVFEVKMCTFHQLFCHLHARHWVGWDMRRKSNYKNKFVFVPQPKSVNQHCSIGLTDVHQLAAEESMSLRNSTFTNLNQSDRNFTLCSMMIRINHEELLPCSLLFSNVSNSELCSSEKSFESRKGQLCSEESGPKWSYTFLALYIHL